MVGVRVVVDSGGGGGDGGVKWRSTWDWRSSGGFDLEVRVGTVVELTEL